MFYRLSIFVLMILLPGVVFSQGLLTWERIEYGPVNLHPGIEAFRASGRINGDTVTAFFIKTNIRNPELVFAPLFSEINHKPERYLSESEGDIQVLTNGGYFGTNVSYSLVISNYTLFAPNARSVTRPFGTTNYTYYPTRSAFGITPDLLAESGYVYSLTASGPTYFYPDPSPNTTQALPLPQPDGFFPENGKVWEVSDAIGGGPLLIQESTINEWFEPELFPADIISSIAPRTAIGINSEGELIQMVVDGRQDHSRGVSLETLAQLLLEVGCVQAINLDGGGSSCIFLGDSLLNQPSDGNTRYIPSVVSVKKAELWSVEDENHFTSKGEIFERMEQGLWGLPPERIYPPGEIGSFLATDVQPAEYRIEFLHHSTGEDKGCEKLEFVISHSMEETDTIIINQNTAGSGKFIMLGIFQLGKADSIKIFNHDEQSGASVGTLRLVRTATGIPFMDLVPGIYTGSHSLHDSLHLKVIARARNSSRKITAMRIYEQAGENLLLLRSENFSPVTEFADSLNYKILKNQDPFRILFVAEDELSDTSMIAYTINLDNSPPTVSLGRNSVLSGNVGDSLFFELKVLPASSNRPLDILRIEKNPDGQKQLLSELVPSPTGDTIVFPYRLLSGDKPGVIFRFTISDTMGFSSYRDLAVALNPVEILKERQGSLNWNQNLNQLNYIPGNTGFEESSILRVFDLNGRLRFSMEFSTARTAVFDLSALPSGIFLAAVQGKNAGFYMKFVKLTGE